MFFHFPSFHKWLLPLLKLDVTMEGQTQKQLAELPDAELFLEIAAKKSAALAILYDRYSPQLFGLAIKILQDEQLAEDVLQDLFLYLWENPEKFNRSRGAPLAWITIICRNRCIDKLRSKQRAPRSSIINEEIVQNLITDESESPFAIVNYNEMHNSVSGALDKLPEEQRRPIEMAYFEGLSQTEISDILNQPLGTVKTRMRLGMQKLRTLMKQLTE